MSEQDIILHRYMGIHVIIFISNFMLFFEIINFYFRQRVKVQLRVATDKMPNNLFIRKIILLIKDKVIYSVLILLCFFFKDLLVLQPHYM